MCFRFFYAIREAWHYKKQLSFYMQRPDLQVTNVRDLAKINLESLQVTAIVFDYDGVLAAHGEPIIRPEIAAWLRDFCTVTQAKHLYVLTNKPSMQRQEYFQQNFPNVKFIWAKRKKPYPDGLQQIVADAGIPASQLLLVDDRLLTGILATLIAGTQALWVTKPYVNFKFRPLAEAGIMILRWLERAGVKLLGS